MVSLSPTLATLQSTFTLCSSDFPSFSTLACCAGESVPVRKVPYNPNSDGLGYSPDKSTGCTLFGGTMVAQVCLRWSSAVH